MATVAGGVVRHYGDPAAEYRAARHGAVVVDRADRALLRVHGREPVKMIQGLVTNDVTAPERNGVYAGLLTPKGKLVADLRVLRRDGELLLELDAAAVQAAVAHLRHYVPPLFARVEEVTAAHAVLGVYGPGARGVVETALGAALPAPLPEDSWAGSRFGAAAGADGGGESAAVAGASAAVLAVRACSYAEDGYDLIAPAAAREPLRQALVEAGGVPAGHGTLEALRIEAGIPRWGAELDESVIPLEAGLRERAISETKGCYTGQEVIVRVLHRGHVNRLLRGLLLGDAPTPAAGAELRAPGGEKVLGRITSACASPRHAQTIGLGYVRREVEPPATLLLPGGGEVLVVALPFPTGDLGQPAAGAGES
jgi:tRNA-modifying protein YgfZ